MYPTMGDTCVTNPAGFDCGQASLANGTGKSSSDQPIHGLDEGRQMHIPVHKVSVLEYSMVGSDGEISPHPVGKC